jgi:hypothetical protein
LGCHVHTTRGENTPADAARQGYATWRMIFGLPGNAPVEIEAILEVE